VAARGQAGGREHELARRRTQTSGGGDGGGYQLRRWSNSKAGVDWKRHFFNSLPRCKHRDKIRSATISNPALRHHLVRAVLSVI